MEEPLIERAFTELQSTDCKVDRSFFVSDAQRIEKERAEIEQYKLDTQEIDTLIFGDTRTHSPVIVNEASKFVVVTYWWGNENKNKNYARPCPVFYEDLLNLPMDTIMSADIWKLVKDKNVEKLKKHIEVSIKIKKKLEDGSSVNETKIVKMSYLRNVITHGTTFFKNMFKKLVKAYYNERVSIVGKDKTPPEKQIAYVLYNLLIKVIDTNIEIYTQIIAAKQCIDTLKNKLFELQEKNKQINLLKKEIEICKNFQKELEIKFSESTSEIHKKSIQERMKANETDLEKNIESLTLLTGIIETLRNEDESQTRLNLVKYKALQAYNASLKSTLLRNFQSQASLFTDILGGSTYLQKLTKDKQEESQTLRGALETFLRFKDPISFKTMIANWEAILKRANCNYLSVQYAQEIIDGTDENKKRKMYQLLINAKPDFIKKALEICKGRSIVYIDGDMEIKSYPHLFDMPDYDFMARGWNTDPRGGEKFIVDEEYSVAPYRFETSGGIMYFGQTEGSKRLIDLWISETKKPEMRGKADDRIISLMFNQKGLLAPLKIFQLPVEYLYLDLWYNDYLDPEEHLGRVYVSHPQCLTSEETAATSGGASSNREPAGYKEILSDQYATAEPYYESIVFSDNKYADSVRGWLNFVNSLRYNEKIISKQDTFRLNNRTLFEVQPWGQYGKHTRNYLKNMQAFEYKNTNQLLNNVLETVPMSFEKLLTVDQMRIIPKIVHQIWFGNKEIPEYKKAMMKTVETAAKCAGWTYKLWTQKDFTEKNFPNVWAYCQIAIKAGEKYKQSRWAQVVDLCRYELMCRFGGAYLDTNFFASVKLFNIIEEMNTRNRQVIVCNEDPCKMDCEGKAGKYLSNSFICSVRHHPVFQHLISEERLDSINFDREKTFEQVEQSFMIHHTTGPYYLRSGFDILEEDYSEVGILEPHQIYPIPMSKSELRDDVPNVCIVPITDQRVVNGTVQFVKVDASRVLLLNCWEKAYPDSYAAYMVGLGGSWDYSEALEEQRRIWAERSAVVPLEVAPEEIQQQVAEATAISVAEADRNSEYPGQLAEANMLSV